MMNYRNHVFLINIAVHVELSSENIAQYYHIYITTYIAICHTTSHNNETLLYIHWQIQGVRRGGGFRSNPLCDVKERETNN